MTPSKRTMPAVATVKKIRCAIYTRKSTEEGLQQEFNTLDAQRESAEKYIASQEHEGWRCLPDRYDDGGFTGGNIERPALKLLLADIEAGKVDCVVVYKVDRLSRSLMDFSRLMETFDKHQVSFVSVTQQFNTTHSMGRLTLNILLSFAQFEREIISERTRDKIAAARRKGEWAGGMPLLGYDTLKSPVGTKLVVNEDEAIRVRAIFDLYLKHEALVPTVKEITARGWITKQWTIGSETSSSHVRGGRLFDKVSLYKLLTNPTYIGKVRYKTEVHAGEHQGIVQPEVFQQVQSILQRNYRTGGALVRNKYGALLKGILECGSCKCSMRHAYSSKGTTRYRYYVCLNAQKRGWHTCQTKSVRAGEIEKFVVEQIRSMGKDPRLAAMTTSKAQLAAGRKIAELESERAVLERDQRRIGRDIERSLGDPDRLADLNEWMTRSERRQAEITEQLQILRGHLIGDQEVAESLAAFDSVWAAMSPKEQARLLRLMVSRVSYNGVTGSIAITFRPNGLEGIGDKRQEAVA